jgi:guanylate kinase
MNRPAHGIVFLLVGPGGAGKNTLLKHLLPHLPSTLALSELVTATTRPPRNGEQHTVDYHFKTHTEFEAMIERDELIEYQQVTSGNYYGVPRASVDPLIARGESVIADVDVLGADTILHEYPQEACAIFVTVGDADTSVQERLAILEARMRGRNDSEAHIAERLKRAVDLEFPFQSKCAYTVYNNDVNQAATDLIHAIEHALHTHHELVAESS